MRDKALSCGFLIAVLLLWQAVVILFDVSPLVFPAPSKVLLALYNGVASGEFFPHTAVTLYEMLAGYGIGAGIGFLLGVLIAQLPLLKKVLYPYIVAFQTVPKVAIAPLFVVWFGFGVASKIVITATVVFFPVLANTIVGLHSAPRDQLDMLAAYTASKWQVLRMVRFPHALPYIFVGLHVGIVLSVIGAIVGEFVGAQSGLGYLILQRNFSMDTAGVFAILLVLSAIGIGLHALTQFIERRVIFWREPPAHSAVEHS
jgi:NitT/TauT family transport system permease protein